MLFKKKKDRLYLKIIVEAPDTTKKNRRVHNNLLKVKQMIYRDLKWLINKKEFRDFKDVFVRVQIYLEEEKEEEE